MRNEAGNGGGSGVQSTMPLQGFGARDADVADALGAMLFGADAGFVQQGAAGIGALQNLAGDIGDSNSGFEEPMADAETTDFFNFAGDQAAEPEILPTNLLSCGQCQHQTNDMNTALLHQHDTHEAPNSQLCSCSICAMMFVGDEGGIAALVHAQMLAAGALELVWLKDGVGAGDTREEDGIAGADVMDFDMGYANGLGQEMGGMIDPLLLGMF